MNRKEAYDALDRAIADVAIAEEWTGVITGWVAVAGCVDMIDGEERSGVEILTPLSGAAWTQTLGIVEAGRLRLQQQFLSGGEDGP